MLENSVGWAAKVSGRPFRACIYLLALETRSSADYQLVDGQLERKKRPVWIRGLNLNHNHDLKNIFKSAATSASAHEGPFRTFYEGLLAKGMVPAMARLTLAPKIAAITLSVWKKGETFDAEQLKPQAAWACRSGAEGISTSGVVRSARSARGFEGEHLKLVRPKSLTRYHMPPRITQQSLRPRASDRTMVGNSPPR